MNKSELKPAVVFEQFAKINQIPRPSKREDKMIEYLKNFGESHKLETKVDDVGNVIIRKPATPGFEDCKTVILQSHMDMVCDRLADHPIDFDKDPIVTYIDGEWMRAKGTTLGADDGIGCAMELAILESNDIEHGPIECVFTRDEETGLTGAFGMKSDFMTGDYLINLDSEDEGEIFVSCAGGRTTAATLDIKRQPAPEGYFFIKGSVKGLVGGHSGDDINKKRANGLKIIARFVYQEMERYEDVHLVRLHGGSLHNAIPREATCVCCVPEKYKEQLRADWNIFAAEVEEEYSQTEPTMEFILESDMSAVGSVVAKATSDKLIAALQAVDNGVYAMCQGIDLVETSSNLASIHMVPESKTININSSQRSSIYSARVNMANTVAAVFELAGAKVEIGEGYPGWKMNPQSELLKLAVEEYKKLFGRDPKVRGIHAGLECGLFSEKYPHLDMISIGPTLRGVHSPDERLLIPTVQMVWDHVLAILKNAPLNN